MERVNVFLLHGFLGRPQDWSAVQACFTRQEKILFKVPDYFRIDKLSPTQPFEQWAQNFNKWVEQEVGLHRKNVLVGYSLGARLAMHALRHNSSLWSKVMLISGNPGFDDEHESFTESSEERKQRWISDSYWAEEFLTGAWDTVIRNWNAQPVFGGGRSEPTREEKNYSRDLLSLALTQWSLAQQKNMRSILEENIDKIYWIVGALDERYAELSRRLKERMGKLKVDIIPEASHRVLFDKPQDVADRIHHLLIEM